MVPVEGVAAAGYRHGAGDALDHVNEDDSPVAALAITSIAVIIYLVTTRCTASAKGAKCRAAERDRFSDELGIYLQD